MQKEEILKQLDQNLVVLAKDVVWEINEDSIILTTSDGFVKEKIFPKIVPQISQVTGKKVYAKYEQPREPTEGEDSLIGKIMGARKALEPSFTFDKLVVGQFNESAVQACQKLIELPPKESGILMVWGGTGLGKSHIIQASAWKMYDQNEAVYVTDSMHFIDEVLQAAKTKMYLPLHTQWNNAKLLIFDDLQVLSQKIKKMPSVEAELFNLMIRFSENGKRAIFASDRNPMSLGFDDRIAFRLAQSNFVITRPDLMARMDIVSMLLKEKNRKIDTKYIELIASKLNQNIRQLLGAVNTLDIRMELGFTVDDAMIDAVIASLTLNPRMSGTDPLEKVAQVVTNYMAVDRSVLMAKRGRNKARQVAIAASRIAFPDITVERIANFFNTARKSVYEVAERDKEDNEVKAVITIIKSEEL